MTASRTGGPALARAGFGAAALTAWPLGWWLGTALQLEQRALGPLWAYGVVLAAALGLAWAVLRLSRRAGWARRWGVVALLAASALGAWGAAGWRAHTIVQDALASALEGRDLEVTGVVSRMPQVSEMGWRMAFAVQEARLDGVPVRVPGHVQLTWYRSARWPGRAGQALPEAPIVAGDRWQFVVRLRAPHGNLNPHGFDQELWLWQQGVGATGYVRTGARQPPPQRLAQGVGHIVERARQDVRDRIIALAADGDEAARRRAGIVAALVTGDQNVIERSDWDVFRATGVAHLMSISGLHITMFAWLAAAAVGWAWRRSARWGRCNPCLWLPAPNAAWIGGVLLATGYAVFSGWGVPAQRTILMLSCMVLLRLSGLVWPWWLGWLWAGVLVLLLDPWAMLQAGFWLSFVAVGVLFATDARAADRGQAGLRRHLLQLLREQGVVTLALTPLSLILFGQASVVGLLANLVAIPWVTLVVTPTALAGILWPPLWQLAMGALEPLAALLQWLASWPWAQLSLPAVPLALGVLALAGGILLALRWPLAVRLAGMPMLLPFLLWQPARPAPGTFELLVIDVGQGSAVLARTARHTLLYDTGPRYSQDSDAGQRVLVPLLRALDERVDRVVLSHSDSDHTGGALAVQAMQPQALVMAPVAQGPSQPCHAGQSWDWDGVRFEMLHPDPGEAATARKSNATSCVLRVQSAGGGSALLAGDIERAQEQALIARGAQLGSDALLVPHHGSKTSSSAEFIEAVRPRLALVQSGYRNRFGHPAPTVLARYAARGVRVVASPECGAMRWSSSAPDVVRCEREVAARYWHHRGDGP